MTRHPQLLSKKVLPSVSATDSLFLEEAAETRITRKATAQSQVVETVCSKEVP
jgi:hypothetical protein